jgi:hypothetical protein
MVLYPKTIKALSEKALSGRRASSGFRLFVNQNQQNCGGNQLYGIYTNISG